jgi:hypothetical protein
VALGGEGVQFGAGQPPAGGDEFGADALRDQALRVAAGNAGAERVLPGGLAADRDAAHRLHSGGDDGVVRAGHHALRREVDGLLAAAALPVDGHRGN